jgi:hypothetical protein
MMPVSGEISPATARTAGSNFRICSGPTGSILTPLRRAAAARMSSAGLCSSSVATISLPIRRWGTPCSAQKR